MDGEKDRSQGHTVELREELLIYHVTGHVFDLQHRYIHMYRCNFLLLIGNMVGFLQRRGSGKQSSSEATRAFYSIQLYPSFLFNSLIGT